LNGLPGAKLRSLHARSLDTISTGYAADVAALPFAERRV